MIHYYKRSFYVFNRIKLLTISFEVPFVTVIFLIKPYINMFIVISNLTPTC